MTPTPIHRHAEQYLAMRRGLGFKLTTFGQKLFSFIDYLQAHDLNTITTEAALDWATSTPRSSDQVHWSRRMMVARIFARHMAVLNPATEIPPTDILPHHYRRITPHLYAPEQVTALLDAADGLRPPRALTWHTLICLESEDMRCRALIAATSMAALGQVVQGLGELTELALPTGEPLPSRPGMSHVHAVEAVTERLRGVARQFGGQAELFGAAAKYYTRWMKVPATDAIKARLGAALAELNTEAGWCCYDSGVDGMGFFTCALGLADEVGAVSESPTRPSTPG